MAEFFGGGRLFSNEKKSQDAVRKSLRLIKGGKDVLPAMSLSTDGLENDPFLRTHYLVKEKPERKPVAWVEGRQYLLTPFFNGEFPSDAS